MREQTLTRATLRTPKAAAAAGIIFSLLLIAVLFLLRISVPADPMEPGAWLRTSPRVVALALNLVPFAGIAFLWFIGVLRDRLARREDQFFATVFFGSGLLFLAMLFVAAAAIGAIILTFVDQPKELVDSATFRFPRTLVYALVNIYMIKTAAVFMISTSTVVVYTGFAPHWIALLGYGLALIVLFGSCYIAWSFVVFPFWVLLLSAYILIDNLRRPAPDDSSQKTIQTTFVA
jgi:hypothetical protein